MKNMKSVYRLVFLVAVFTAVPLSNVFAQSGFYAGGSLGQSALEVDLGDTQSGFFKFDENDFAWKAYGGFAWDLPVVEFAIEGGYVDFGSPSAAIESASYNLDSDGWNVWGIAGLDIGPIGVFGKIGYVAWDVSGSSLGDVRESFSDDGSDLGYGIGAKIMLGALEVRGEFEIYDIDGAQSLSLLSAGLVLKF